MSYLGDLAVVLCLWLWAFGVAHMLIMWRWVQTHAVGQLLGLTIIAALGWLVCLVGYTPAVPLAAPLEMLGMHPVLGPVMWICGAVGGCTAMRCAWRVQASKLSPLTPSEVWGLLAVSIALGCAWIWALGPPLHPDESLYHLSLPLQYIRSGGYVLVEGHGNSGFFALGDMLFWWCLVAGAPGAARQMQLLVTMVGWAALITQATSHVRVRVIWAWAMWLCVPIVLWELGSAYVDAMEAVLTLVGLSCLARWWRAPSPRDDSYLVQAAWLMGAAAACRQLALSSLPALGLVVLLRLRREAQGPAGRIQKPKHAAAAFGACCALPLMFALHNAWVFGNPVYPFAADVFTGTIGLRPSQLQVLDQFLAQHGPMLADASRTGLDALWHLPWALLFDAQFSSSKFDGVIGPLPLVVAGVGLFRLWKRKAALAGDGQEQAMQYLLLGCAGLRGAIWLSTSWQARFLIMPLGALSLWACLAWPAGLRWRMPGLMRGASTRLGAAAAMLAALASLKGHTPIWDARYLGAPQMRYQARLAQLPQSRLCALAAQDGPDARVMLVWTQRLACFCPSALWSDSYDEAATLVAWLEDAGSPSVVARLRAAHISHLLVDEAAFGQVPAALDAVERRRWQTVLDGWQAVVQRDLRLEAVEGAVRLYAVRPL